MKKYMLLTAVSACLILNACSGEKADSATLLKQAVASARTAKWEDALALSEEALKQSPKNTDITLFTVLALEKNGKTEDALSRIRSLEKMKDNFQVQYTLGRLLFRKGAVERCVAPLRNALKVRPGDKNAAILLSRALVRLGTNDAIKYQADLLKKEEFRTPENWNEFGVLLALTGNPVKQKQAAAVFEQKGAGLPVAVLNCGIVYDWYLNNPAKAVEYYNKYLRMTAKNPELDTERLHVTQRLQEIR